MISWVKMYTKDMVAYAFGKVGQKKIAEDLVQDTFLSAYQSYKNFKAKSSVKTWLFSILKHKITDYYRLKYKENPEVASEIIDKFFDKNNRWIPEYKPANWGYEKEFLDDPEFSKALNNCFDNFLKNGRLQSS